VLTAVGSLRFTEAITVHAQLNPETLALVGHGARV
jgi:hypothetical protein